MTENSVRLGLGDFIFYSVLIGRAAMYDITTVFTCLLAIVTVWMDNWMAIPREMKTDNCTVGIILDLNFVGTIQESFASTTILHLLGIHLLLFNTCFPCPLCAIAGLKWHFPLNKLMWMIRYLESWNLNHLIQHRRIYIWMPTALYFLRGTAGRMVSSTTIKRGRGMSKVVPLSNFFLPHNSITLRFRGYHSRNYKPLFIGIWSDSTCRFIFCGTSKSTLSGGIHVIGDLEEMSENTGGWEGSLR